MIEKETSKHFDNIAPNWENKIWVNKEEFDNKIIAMADLKGDEIALDIGIGTGALAKKMPVKEMHGLDISHGMMEKCSLPRQRLHIGTGERAPFMDNTFDFVMARNLLKHVNDISLVLTEMKRILKPDGKLLIVESTPYTRDQCEVPSMAVRVVEPYHPRFFSKDELRVMIEMAGFKIKKQELEVMRDKWLQKWMVAKNATQDQGKRIFEIYKNAHETFKKEQRVELFEDEMEIISDFPWSIVLAIKKDYK